MAAGNVWAEFERDPRAPGHAHLRASDRDRAVVHETLIAAYGDGRLDHQELEERSEFVTAAKTLGQLVGVLGDLVPPEGTPSRTGRDELAHLGRLAFARRRRDAVTAFVVTSLVCWAIYLALFAATGSLGHPWPVWVMLGTGLNLVRVLLLRQRIIDGEIRNRIRQEQVRIQAQQRWHAHQQWRNHQLAQTQGVPRQPLWPAPPRRPR